MEKERITTAVSIESAKDFKDACTLACALYATEAFRRYAGMPAHDKQHLVGLGLEYLPMIHQAIGRDTNGLRVDELMALIQLMLRENKLDQAVRMQNDMKITREDLFLMPGELLLISGLLEAHPEKIHHRIMAYVISLEEVLVVDPATARSETFSILPTVEGGVRLYNRKADSVDVSMMLVDSAIRLSFEKQKRTPPPPTDDNERKRRHEHTVETLILLKAVMRQPGPLINPKVTGKSIEESAIFLQGLMAVLEDAETWTKKDIETIDFKDRHMVTELRMHVADIRRLIDENNWMEWFRHHKLLPPDPNEKPVPPPVEWPLSQLESRLSPAFKAAREKKIKMAVALLENPDQDPPKLNQQMYHLTSEYAELAMLAQAEIQNIDVHRVLTSYYKLLKKLMALPQIKQAQDSNDVYQININNNWTLILNGRKQFKVEL
ncbi:MAG: hypothetical protein AB7N80_11125 [Bdellovibrionales bacterium]